MDRPDCMRLEESDKRQPNDFGTPPARPSRGRVQRTAQLSGKSNGDLICHVVHCSAMQARLDSGATIPGRKNV